MQEVTCSGDHGSSKHNQSGYIYTYTLQLLIIHNYSVMSGFNQQWRSAMMCYCLVLTVPLSITTACKVRIYLIANAITLIGKNLSIYNHHLPSPRPASLMKSSHHFHLQASLGITIYISQHGLMDSHHGIYLKKHIAILMKTPRN